MAGTLQVNINAALTNGRHKETFGPGAQTITQTGQGAHAPIQIVGTSEETVAVGDISTLGWAFFQNLSTENYVTLGPDSTGMVGFIRLKPGESCCLRLEPGITIKAQANTAPVNLKVLILED